MSALLESCKEVITIGGTVGTIGVGAMAKLWSSLTKCQTSLEEALKRSDSRLDAILAKLRS